jgi:hypothetical protein
MTEVQAELDAWDIDRLRAVSPRPPPHPWRGFPQRVMPVSLTDPVALAAVACVIMRIWRTILKDEWRFPVRSIFRDCPSRVAASRATWREIHNCPRTALRKASAISVSRRRSSRGVPTNRSRRSDWSVDGKRLSTWAPLDAADPPDGRRMSSYPRMAEIRLRENNLRLGRRHPWR